MIPKFRAWDSVKKEMFTDTFAITESGQVVVVEQEFVTSTPDYVFVEHLTIMQSTGLKDKNGKEIFEGDVIAIEVDDTGMPINARVFQNSKIGVLMFHVFEDNEDVPMVELLEDNSVAFEIIGNIYENPEFMEVE
nr:MAG TPA: YopX protein [Caudoviricetes sp.]